MEKTRLQGYAMSSPLHAFLKEYIGPFISTNNFIEQ